MLAADSGGGQRERAAGGPSGGKWAGAGGAFARAAAWVHPGPPAGHRRRGEPGPGLRRRRQCPGAGLLPGRGGLPRRVPGGRGGGRGDPTGVSVPAAAMDAGAGGRARLPRRRRDGADFPMAPAAAATGISLVCALRGRPGPALGACPALRGLAARRRTRLRGPGWRPADRLRGLRDAGPRRVRRRRRGRVLPGARPHPRDFAGTDELRLFLQASLCRGPQLGQIPGGYGWESPIATSGWLARVLLGLCRHRVWTASGYLDWRKAAGYARGRAESRRGPAASPNA